MKLKNVKLRPLKGNKNPIRNRYHFKVTSSPFIHSYCVNVQFLWPLLTSEQSPNINVNKQSKRSSRPSTPNSERVPERRTASGAAVKFNNPTPKWEGYVMTATAMSNLISVTSCSPRKMFNGKKNGFLTTHYKIDTF